MSTSLNTCVVAVLADYKFFVEHGSNAADAASLMVSFIDYANTIFRASNFAGLTNIGISVGKVVDEDEE